MSPADGKGAPRRVEGPPLDDGLPHLERARRRDFVRHGWVHFGWLAAGAALGGGAVVLVGLFDVSAKDGHWPGVPWVLHTTYQRSVELRSPPASEVPPLDDEALVALGARHFDQACSQCHSAPGERQDATVRSMLPRPPHVTEAVEGWDAENLFWILKEGVKMSGMPHWPSYERDDDVWSVVAFLERVDGMSGARYEKLVRPALGASAGEAPGDAALVGCAACHGLDGRSRGNPHVPRLDLHSEAYLAASLEAYRANERHSGLMQQAASVLTDEDIERLAAHYAGAGTTAIADAGGTDAAAGDAAEIAVPTNVTGEARLRPVTAEARAALIEAGARLAVSAPADGDGARPGRDAQQPACAACHGPWPHRITERYPRLAGQHEAYLLTQLQLWKAGTRGGTTLAEMMHEVAPTLDEREMRALAAYYADLPAGGAIGSAVP